MILLLEIARKTAEHRFDPVFLVIGRDEEQQAGLGHARFQYQRNRMAGRAKVVQEIFNSRWMPNFSTRLRRVARVMPSSLAACTWLPLVSLSAWMTSSRSTAGITFKLGSFCASAKSRRA